MTSSTRAGGPESGGVGAPIDVACASASGAGDVTLLDSARGESDHAERRERGVAGVTSAASASPSERSPHLDDETVARWEHSYAQEVAGFRDLADYAAVQLNEALESSSHLGVPNRVRTAICCDLIDKVCARFDRYHSFLSQLRRHLYGAVYVDGEELADKLEAGEGSAGLFFRAEPYFEAVSKLLSDKREREREILLWERKRAQGRRSVEAKDRVMTTMARKWQRTTLQQLFNVWSRMTQRSRQQRRVLAQTLMRWQSKDVGAYFHAWSLYAARRRRRRRGVELHTAETKLLELRSERERLEDDAHAARQQLDELRTEVEASDERRREDEREIRRLQRILDDSGETQLREQAGLWAALCGSLVREELRWMVYHLEQAVGKDVRLTDISIEGDDDEDPAPGPTEMGGRPAQNEEGENEDENEKGDEEEEEEEGGEPEGSPSPGGDERSGPSVDTGKGSGGRRLSQGRRARRQGEGARGGASPAAPDWREWAGKTFVAVGDLLAETETVEALRAAREEARQGQGQGGGKGSGATPRSPPTGLARRAAARGTWEASAATKMQLSYRRRLDQRALRRRRQWDAQTSLEDKFAYLRALPVDMLLLRWVNLQLRRSGSRRLVENFSSDWKDSLCFAELLACLSEDTGVEFSTHLHAEDYYARAHTVLRRLEKVQCPPLITAASIVKGEADLTIAVVAFLFTHYPCLHPRERPFPDAHAAVEGARREWAAVRSLWAISPDYVEPSKLRRLARSTVHASEQVRHAASRAAADVCHWRALRDRARDFAFQCLLQRARGDPAQIPDRKAEREREQFTRISRGKLQSLLEERAGGVEPEEALAKITQVLEDNFEDLKRIYKHYAATDEEGSAGTLSLEEMWTFVQECRLLSKALTPERVKQAFSDSHQTGTAPTDPNHPDSELTINEFVEALVRLANYRMEGEGNLSLGDRLEKVLTQRVLLFACRSNAARFRSRLEAQDVQAVLQRYSDVLQEAYRTYADPHSGQVTLDGFRRFVKDRSLNDGHLTDSAVAAMFQRVQQDEDTAAAGGAGVEGVEDDMASLMSYPEFTEACAALAVFKIPNPYLPISQRLHDFVTKMVVTKALKKRMGQQSPKKRRASLQSQDTDQ